MERRPGKGPQRMYLERPTVCIITKCMDPALFRRRYLAALLERSRWMGQVGYRSRPLYCRPEHGHDSAERHG